MDTDKILSNLAAVQAAIQDLVRGERLVKVDFVTAEGYKSSKEYTNVSLNELKQLERDYNESLNPTPIMQSLGVEVEF
ncbi:TPA: gpW family head-tail joining protein [Vibrio parahaemolyticus]